MLLTVTLLSPSTILLSVLAPTIAVDGILNNCAPLPLKCFPAPLNKILPVTSISCSNFCLAVNVFTSDKLTLPWLELISLICCCNDAVPLPNVPLVTNPKSSTCADDETILAGIFDNEL